MLLMSDVRAGLAEMHEAAGRHDMARMCRESASEDRIAEMEDEITRRTEGADAALSTVLELLDEVKRSPKNAKHDDECWQRHAACLARRIRKEL